jgi:glycosyltransferase involved in cell wall biosynthesis
VRLVAYTDYVYRRRDGALYAQRAFALFLARIGEQVDRLTLAGRLDPEAGEWHYRLPESVELAPLPHYPALSQPLRALPGILRAVGRIWRSLDDADAAWVLGPYPTSFLFVLIARLRRRRVYLGVRQDWPVYVASRHPGNRPLLALARVMEAAWRALARRYPVVVVGPQLARNYSDARAVLPVVVSMIDEDQIAPPREGFPRGGGEPPRTGSAADREIKVLSVGRLETEKNPLLLADILAGLGSGWRLVVAGEGSMRADLEARLDELGIADRADLRGYVPIDAGLHDLYRECDVFLHVSWTEGLPQVVFESFAARLPVVATAVGGVPEAVGDAGVLIPPGDAGAAVESLRRVADDAELRERIVERGVERVRAHTTEVETRKIAEFLGARG